MAHVFPFHSSAGAPESLWPTATQVVADGHETALRSAAALGRLPCGGLGVCWIAQVFPFHRSATVPLELELTYDPAQTREVTRRPSRRAAPRTHRGLLSHAGQR